MSSSSQMLGANDLVSLSYMSGNLESSLNLAICRYTVNSNSKIYCKGCKACSEDMFAGTRAGDNRPTSIILIIILVRKGWPRGISDIQVKFSYKVTLARQPLWTYLNVSTKTWQHSVIDSPGPHYLHLMHLPHEKRRMCHSPCFSPLDLRLAFEISQPSSGAHNQCRSATNFH